MNPKIEILTQKMLVGKQLTMSLESNQTFRLWQAFMAARTSIKDTVSANFFSVHVYPATFDFTFRDLGAEFQNWAAVEVSEFDEVPNEMETFVIPSGLYAVFHYKGLSSDIGIFKYIYGTWLPASNYNIDSRPHFEILGEKYKNNDPESEEDIWIPIMEK